MTRAFKKRVKPRPLQRGDLVLKVIRGLIRDPKGKFRPNWGSPYFIRELTLEGVVWLMDLDGNRFLELTKDENIGNHRYIGTSILQIYRIYRRIFWKKISISLKSIKIYKNIRKTS